MKIVPTSSDLQKWARCVPTQGDLLFLDKSALKNIPSLPFPILSAEELRAQAVALWTLNARSWYGYSLNRAEACVFFPQGSLEKQSLKFRKVLAQTQLRLEVPTLILSSRLPKDVAEKLAKFGKHHWLSSQSWKTLTLGQRARVIKAWFVQNEIVTYESPSLDEVPVSVRRRLKRLGFDALLSCYACESGSNCLATAAAAASGNRELVGQWLHGPPFLRFLKKLGYKKLRAASPQEGDTLVFSQEGQLVHAAHYLGHGLYFEKPGQDFYEPYRIESFRNWKSHWPDASLAIWRK